MATSEIIKQLISRIDEFTVSELEMLSLKIDVELYERDLTNQKLKDE